MQPELLTRAGVDDVLRYVCDDHFGLQEKWDAERLLVRRCEGEIKGWNKRGQPASVSRPLQSALRAINVARFSLDGEIDDSCYYCWDLLEAESEDLTSLPYETRYQVLQVFAGCPFLKILPLWTGKQAKAETIVQLWRRGAEGVVFKNLEAPYRPGRAGQHFKFKFEQSATARVSKVDPTRDRAEIEMVDVSGNWHRVSGIKVKNGSVRPGDFLEVRFSSATANKHLAQPVFIRTRTDVCDQDCSIDQLEFRGRWAIDRLIEQLV